MSRRNPFNEYKTDFTSLFGNDFLNSIMNDVFGNNLVNEINQEQDFKIKLKDYGEYYLIKGYLPGVDPRDVSIDFEKNKAILTIKRRQVYSNNQNFMITIVQTGGDLVKTFYIGEVDVGNLKASFEDSLLLLTIPKVKKIEDNRDGAKIIDVDSYKVE